MATNTKTPLHSVVSVMCDLLAELSPEEQTRALEAARVSLGLRTPRAVPDMNPYPDGAQRPALPLVEIQMMGDRPVVVNEPAAQTANRLVIAGPRRTAVMQPRQLPAPREPRGPAQDSAARGYVRTIR